MESYIRCTHVDYESTRTETFFDIQLNVKDKKDGTNDYIQEQYSSDFKEFLNGMSICSVTVVVLF